MPRKTLWLAPRSLWIFICICTRWTQRCFFTIKVRLDGFKPGFILIWQQMWKWVHVTDWVPNIVSFILKGHFKKEMIYQLIMWFGAWCISQMFISSLPDWWYKLAHNLSITTGWTDMNFGPFMVPRVCTRATFPMQPPWGWCMWLRVNCLDYYWMKCPPSSDLNYTFYTLLMMTTYVKEINSPL